VGLRAKDTPATETTPRSARTPWRGSLIFMAAAGVLAVAFPACAQESVVNFDPAKTEIDFTLGDVLHTVHGSFKLKTGQIRFDPASGKASGAVVVDATSGDSGNKSRDKKMHSEILESEKFTEIAFIPSHVNGSIAPSGTSQVEVAGIFRLHGQDHEMTLTVTVQHDAGGQLEVATHFSVPYVAWGIHDPSTFLLRVSKIVGIEIHTTVQLASSEPSR
jgi:polyisoprenoid-binding protein YceI